MSAIVPPNSVFCLAHMVYIYVFFPFLDKDLSYDHLALGLKEALQNDKSAFDADRLQKYTGNLNFLVILLLYLTFGSFFLLFFFFCKFSHIRYTC